MDLITDWWWAARASAAARTSMPWATYRSTADMRDLHQIDFLSLNGHRIPQGESYPSLVQFLDSWPEVWFKKNVSPLY